MSDISKIISQVMKERLLVRTLCSGSGCALPDDCVATERLVVDSIVKYGAERITTGPGITEYSSFDRSLAAMIDHTLLKPDATTGEVKKLCKEARQFSFASVCVNPSYVALCTKELLGSQVRVCAVIGFPLGATTTRVKVAEVEETLAAGATEFDMVLHIGKLKSGEFEYVENEIRSVVRAVKKANMFHLVKVILETCLLSDEEKIAACLLAKQAGADFVKTSTGFSASGATVGDVALMKLVVGSTVGVKASGGIRTMEDARAMAEFGADRIGASASIKIVNK